MNIDEIKDIINTNFSNLTDKEKIQLNYFSESLEQRLLQVPRNITNKQCIKLWENWLVERSWCNILC